VNKVAVKRYLKGKLQNIHGDRFRIWNLNTNTLDIIKLINRKYSQNNFTDYLTPLEQLL
jgi:hypothetical protein